MNIRQEVEKAIASFAASQKIPVSFEGVAFNKPVNGRWLEVVFVDSIPMVVTVDALRTRVYGFFQISCYSEDGRGLKQLDELTQQIAALFPVHHKELYTTFSVESPPKISPSFPDDKFRCAVVRVKYRQELVATA